MSKKAFTILISIAIILFLALLALLYFKPWHSKRIKGLTKNEYVQDSLPTESREESVNLPVFSAESGFYDSEFELTISCNSGNIFYTLDGSDPANNPSAVHYTSPISIYDNTSAPNRLSAEDDITLGYYQMPTYNVDKGIIVRAVVRDNAGSYGTTVSKSYFVGKNDPYYKNMKVISLVTNPYNLFDGDDGIYIVGNMYYKWQKNNNYDPDLEDWNPKNPTNYNQDGKDWERPALIQVFENGKFVYETNLGIRIAGNASRSHAQKSIRLYAREEYGDKKIRYPFFPGLVDVNGNPIEKFDKLTLRNSGNDTNDACVRDEIVQTLSANLQVGTQAEEPCILFIDGEFWGMYHIKERLEDNYFASHYDVDKKNITIVKNSSFDGSEDIINEYKDLYYLAIAADLSLPENYQVIKDTFDMQSLMDYFAIETYINNYDWLYAGRTPNNLMMWRTNEVIDGKPYCDGKWRFALYDCEYSANLYGQEGTKPEFDAFTNISKRRSWENIGLLFLHLLDNEEFKNDFYENYVKIVENDFSAENAVSLINYYKDTYGEAIDTNYQRYQNRKKYSGLLDYHFDSLIDFYTRRPDYALKYVRQLCDK